MCNDYRSFWMATLKLAKIKMVSAKKESLFYESAFKSMSCFGYLQNNIV